MCNGTFIIIMIGIAFAIVIGVFVGVVVGVVVVVVGVLSIAAAVVAAAVPGLGNAGSGAAPVFIMSGRIYGNRKS